MTALFGVESVATLPQSICFASDITPLFTVLTVGGQDLNSFSIFVLGRIWKPV